MKNWKGLASEIRALLNLQSPPLAITFSNIAPTGIPLYEENMPEPTSDGRTGKVAACCVFWMKAGKRTFTTIPQDHGNCSVGSVTHGLKMLSEVANNSDVLTLLECGWVSKDMIIQLPVVKKRPEFITHGPLEDTSLDPDVILLFVNAMQAMIISDAVSGIQIKGKPQCHIIAMAKEEEAIVLSLGCMLSRVRTGMSATDMTCAIPGSRLSEFVNYLRAARLADTSVAKYASEDMGRFLAMIE
jgi:uncharacterized protein (DUF169 family)